MVLMCSKACGSDLNSPITEKCSILTRKSFRLLIKLRKRVFFVSPVKELMSSAKQRSIVRHVQQSSVPTIKRCVMLFFCTTPLPAAPMVEWNIQSYMCMYISFYMASLDQLFLKTRWSFVWCQTSVGSFQMYNIIWKWENSSPWTRFTECYVFYDIDVIACLLSVVCE